MKNIELNSNEIDIKYEIEVFTKLVQQHNLKLTPQRLELAKWIFKTHTHFSVDDIIHSFYEQGEKVSPATVYRVIQMMLDLKLILEHDFGKGKKYYEHTTNHPHHDHIICNTCGQIYEFDDQLLEKRKSVVASKNGFTMTSHSLTIYGDCIKTDCTYKT